MCQHLGPFEVAGSPFRSTLSLFWPVGILHHELHPLLLSHGVNLPLSCEGLVVTINNLVIEIFCSETLLIKHDV